MQERLEKINKLLRLHENNPDRAEADAALKKAASMMRDYLDSPQATVDERERLRSLQEREKSVERRERAAEKLCGGCGEEKPNHAEKCHLGRIEKQIGWASSIGCFSIVGIIVLWFISGLLDLIARLFG